MTLALVISFARACGGRDIFAAGYYFTRSAIASGAEGVSSQLSN